MRKKLHLFSITALVFLLFGLYPPLGLGAPPNSTDTFSFIHVTDPHIGSGVGNKNSPPVFEDIRKNHADSAFLVNGGDATELGVPGEYTNFMGLIKNTGLPAYHIPGNHESRWTDAGKGYFRQYLGPTYTSWNYSGVHFVTLDTSIAKGQNGHLDKHMLAWLKKDLSLLAKNTPVVLFTHHPIFFDEGIQESNFVDNDWDLWSIVKDYNVRAIFTGHGHLNLFWKVNDISIVMTKAAMDGSYSYIEVDKKSQEMTVYNKQLDPQGLAETVVSVLAKIPLTKALPAPGVRILSPKVNQSLNGSFILQARLDNWKGTPTRVEYKLEDNSWKPLGAAGNTYQTTIDLLNVDDGYRNIWVRAVDDKENNYVDKIQFKVSQNPTVKISWEVNTEAGIQVTPVLGAKYLYVGDISGKIYAFDQATGKKIWEFKTGGAILGSPVLAGSILYTGSADGKVYALYAATGKKLWEYKTGGAVIAQPLVAEGKVLVGSSDYNFYALDEKSGKLLWKFAAGNTIMSRAAYGENTLFFGSWDSNFYALDAATGQEKWRKTLGTSAYYAPAASAPLYYQGAVYTFTTGGRICAFKASTGEALWEGKGSAGLSTPVIFNDAVVNNTQGGAVFAMDPVTGENVWQAETALNNFGSSPAFLGGYILANNLQGKIAALNVDDKTLNWSFKLGDNFILANAAAKGDRIYLGTMAGKLYALTAPAGPKPKFFSLLTAFSDTGSHWARRDLNKLAGLDLLKGFADGSYRPHEQVSRAQVAAALSRYLQFESPSPDFKSDFTDISKHWAAQAIAAMQEKGVAGGFKDSKGKSYFKPDNTIKRSETMVMLARAMDLSKPSPGFVTSFADIDQHWAKDAIMALEEKGIAGGYSEKGQVLFKPENPLNRAELGIFLVRVVDSK